MNFSSLVFGSERLCLEIQVFALSSRNSWISLRFSAFFRTVWGRAGLSVLRSGMIVCLMKFLGIVVSSFETSSLYRM